MGYLGNTPAESFLSFEKQVFTIVNSQTAYTLSFSVTNENDIRLVINNVIQEPGSGKAYTASGTTLTLSAALTNGTDEMYCVFLGRARETVTVPDIQTGNIADDAVTKAKVNFVSDGTAGVEVKGDGGSNDGYIQLNCRQNSHGIKLKSPPHSASQSYTLTFPSTSPATDKFLKTDSSGNLSFADAGGITMVDNWRLNSSFTTSDANPISSNLERNDQAAPSFGYYGSQMSESSGIFTFPSTGIYYVVANIQFYLNGDNQYTGIEIAATDNNSGYDARAVNYSHIKNVSNPTYSFVHCNAMFDITDTSNQKVRFRVVATSSSTTIVADTNYDHTFFRFIRLGDT